MLLLLLLLVLLSHRQRPTVASSGGTASEATSLVLTNPALFGPRRGLQVLQQRVPYRTSRIDFAASGDSGQLVATTVNVARIRVGAAALASGALLLDGLSLGDLEAGTDVCRAAGRQQWRRCDMPGRERISTACICGTLAGQPPFRGSLNTSMG